MGKTLNGDMTWLEQGAYYGYPECCVTWFLTHRTARITPLTDKQESVHGFRGLIPCPTCASKVTHDTLHTLITNRQCPMPFPEDGL